MAGCDFQKFISQIYFIENSPNLYRPFVLVLIIRTKNIKVNSLSTYKKICPKVQGLNEKVNCTGWNLNVNIMLQLKAKNLKLSRNS